MIFSSSQNITNLVELLLLIVCIDRALEAIFVFVRVLAALIKIFIIFLSLCLLMLQTIAPQPLLTALPNDRDKLA